MPPKPRLKSLPVSWMVSPSVPMLRAYASEDPVEHPTCVEFLAAYHNGEEARIRLVFRNGYWLRLTPSYADKEVVRTDDYDWSGTFTLRTREDFSRFHEMWEESGTCPNPRIHEVHGSPWLEEIGTRIDAFAYRHFLVLGHDSYAEVIAEDWHEERVT